MGEAGLGKTFCGWAGQLFVFFTLYLFRRYVESDGWVDVVRSPIFSHMNEISLLQKCIQKMSLVKLIVSHIAVCAA